MSEKTPTILVVDDEAQIRSMLNIFLNAADFKTEECGTGRQAIRVCASVKPDLVLLDLGLPDIDGKDVITDIRSFSQVPIIVLTARTANEEITQALDLGADDYIVKPFNPVILLARLKANLRKAHVRESGTSDLHNGPIHMDLMRHEAYLERKKISLTPKEYELLRYFLINRGRMLTHRQILNDLWGYAHGDDTQYLRVYVGHLRDKLERDPSTPEFIITEPGVGYRMENIPVKVPQESAAA